MKRLLVPIGCVAILVVIGVAYCASPFARSTQRLRVSLIQENGGQRAELQNTGMLPLMVVGCEFVADTNGPNPFLIGDMMQRRIADSTWENVLVRNSCESGKSKQHLLWPRQRMYSSDFFANVGFQYSPGHEFHHGDTVRFLLFPHGAGRENEALSSSQFVVE